MWGLAPASSQDKKAMQVFSVRGTCLSASHSAIKAGAERGQRVCCSSRVDFKFKESSRSPQITPTQPNTFENHSAALILEGRGSKRGQYPAVISRTGLPQPRGAGCQLEGFGSRWSGACSNRGDEVGCVYIRIDQCQADSPHPGRKMAIRAHAPAARSEAEECYSFLHRPRKDLAWAVCWHLTEGGVLFVSNFAELELDPRLPSLRAGRTQPFRSLGCCSSFST